MTPNTPTSSSSSVPVGIGTKVGLGLGVPLTLAGAVTAFVLGDRSEETVGVLVTAAIGALLLLVTIGGRMLQAALRDHGAGDVADAFDDLVNQVGAAHDLALSARTRSEEAVRRATAATHELEARDVDRGQDEAEGAPQFGGFATGILGSSVAYSIAGDLAIDPHDDVVDEPDDRREPELVEPIAAPAGRRLDAPPVPDEGDLTPEAIA